MTICCANCSAWYSKRGWVTVRPDEGAVVMLLRSGQPKPGGHDNETSSNFAVSWAMVADAWFWPLPVARRPSPLARFCSCACCNMTHVGSWGMPGLDAMDGMVAPISMEVIGASAMSSKRQVPPVTVVPLETLLPQVYTPRAVSLSLLIIEPHSPQIMCNFASRADASWMQP